MSLVDRILSRPIAYRLWQSAFAGRKLDVLAAHNDMSAIRRVLDVGCGPGTNAPVFEKAEYLGVDLNPSYIEDARKRYGRDFQVADVRKPEFPVGEGFDFILMNSLLHHIDLASTYSLLERMPDLLTPDGHVHIIELVLPERVSVARAMARADRGNYARPLGDWKTIFTQHLDTVVFEPFAHVTAGVTLISAVYFKGKAKAAASSKEKPKGEAKRAAAKTTSIPPGNA
jgi:SAM-dependent methyltransferase